MADHASTHGALLLLLADVRLPSGAHVHSGGIEQAVDDGVINDIETLQPFLVGRLLSGGRLAAHVAALACRLASSAVPTSAEQWRHVDAEVSARIIAPAVAATSRRQGRSLLRTGLAIFPGPVLVTLSDEPGAGPHLAVVQGALSGQVGVTPFDAAVLAAYGVVTAAASAALRLLGLDPVALAAVVAQLTPLIDIEARAAVSNPTIDPVELPAPAGPLTDLLGQRHAQRKERLFAS